ncbi:MAG: hypothetical protein ACT4PG_06615 [Panacagrimonas sp.]
MSTTQRKSLPESAATDVPKTVPPQEPPPKRPSTHPVTDLPEAFWKSAAKFQRLR